MRIVEACHIKVNGLGLPSTVLDGATHAELAHLNQLYAEEKVLVTDEVQGRGEMTHLAIAFEDGPNGVGVRSYWIIRLE